ncbi:MAG: DUF3703 domain-containing protein [Rhodoferax sp.]|nr:DUF3703 domain-containing protein [Rhodoferax sp.]
MPQRPPFKRIFQDRFRPNPQLLYQRAFRRLERAHMLGRAATVGHVRVNWQMFCWALRHDDAGEGIGQMWRAAATAVLTCPGWIPHGNAGGTTSARCIEDRLSHIG